MTGLPGSPAFDHSTVAYHQQLGFYKNVPHISVWTSNASCVTFTNWFPRVVERLQILCRATDRRRFSEFQL
jgi:hypothetical protein